MLHGSCNIPFLHQTACTRNLKKILFIFDYNVLKANNSANSEFDSKFSSQSSKELDIKCIIEI